MYKQSSLIYHVEIVAKGIKGVSCRVVEGFIYHVWWGMLTGGLCWPNNFSLTTIPRAMQKKYATGRPDQKDLNENLAATQGLAHMIIECNRLFEVQEPVVEMRQEFQGWMQYLQPTLCVFLLFILPYAFMHPLDPS